MSKNLPSTSARRQTFASQVLKAISHPDKLFAHCRRLLRNRRLNCNNPIEFYRRVVDDNAQSDPDRAIGSDSHEHWLQLGEMQFQYLVDHGLQSSHQFLEIGCGNLRLGWRVIRFLEPNHYVGLDISAAILESARQKLVEYNLQEKRPALFLVRDADYRFLPAEAFDCAYAHAVFTQLPLEVIQAVLLGVWYILKPGGLFEFTFNTTDGPACNYLREDFFHPETSILEAVQRAGLIPKVMADWAYHQKKIRAFKPTHCQPEGGGI